LSGQGKRGHGFSALLIAWFLHLIRNRATGTKRGC
jgi:hypothetical protein